MVGKEQRKHTQTHGTQSKSRLIKKHSGDRRDQTVPECVCERTGERARVCVFTLGRWLKHDRPSNETMYSTGPRGFPFEYSDCNELWLFYVKKKLIISPTVTEQ